MGSSRRGSKATTCLQGGSSKMQAASSCAALETGESSGGKGVEAKWKKVLVVSIAIGRMARMAGVSPEDPEERMRTKRCLAGGQLLFETTINCSQVSFELTLLSTMNGFLISALVLGFFEINSYLLLWRKYLNPISKY